MIRDHQHRQHRQHRQVQAGGKVEWVEARSPFFHGQSDNMYASRPGRINAINAMTAFCPWKKGDRASTQTRTDSIAWRRSISVSYDTGRCRLAGDPGSSTSSTEEGRPRLDPLDLAACLYLTMLTMLTMLMIPDLLPIGNGLALIRPGLDAYMLSDKVNVPSQVPRV
jgi:hypothetical protein